ncbi:hypothetical protein RR48_05204 [Papilio machaon]|uniref:FLYWCH-type domain-containing protein n=1 Tax=Papilio machaon TaxID=76193 RepID=A0A0N0PCJ6_PAPMA|nr:hypothetical protein RR48_05204 [Papilio machaon]
MIYVKSTNPHWASVVDYGLVTPNLGCSLCNALKDRVQFLPTDDGKEIVMYQKYTFSFYGRLGRTYLKCSRSTTGKCKVKLKVDASVSYKILPIGNKRSVVLVNDYPYAYTGPGKKYLKCSQSYSMRCNAKLRILPDNTIQFINDTHNHRPKKYFKCSDDEIKFEYVSSGRGKRNLILLEGQTYSVQGRSESMFYCSKKSMTKCKARVFLQLKSKKIPSRGGKELVMCEGFTYNQVSTNVWNCSSRSSKMKCPAKIKFDGTTINSLQSNFQHIHKPPKYVVINNQYIRVITRKDYITKI